MDQNDVYISKSKNYENRFYPIGKMINGKQNFLGICLNFGIEIDKMIVIECENEICIWEVVLRLLFSGNDDGCIDL